MIFTDPIKNAIKFSIKTHEVYQKQKRKGKDIPYITHPLTVGIILALAGAAEEVVVAGILHDTIEDCADEKKVDRKMIAERFGRKAADLVVSVTEKDRCQSWEKRKNAAIRRIAKYSPESLLVKSADVLSNTSELVSDYNRYGDQVFDRFSASKDKVLAHYSEAIRVIIAKWPKNPLVKDLKVVAVDLRRIADIPENQ